MTDHRGMEAPASPLTRVLALFDAFRAAPNDADIEVRIGETEQGEAAVVISIDGAPHALTAAEARMAADIAEDTMHKFPHEAEAATLPNLILALRYGSDRASSALKPR